MARLVPIANRPRLHLQQIVAALNEQIDPGGALWNTEKVHGEEDVRVHNRWCQETPLHLRKLVSAWLSSGAFFEFGRQYRDMYADVQNYWSDAAKLNPVKLVPVLGSGACLFQNSRPEPDPYREALRLFIELLLNPDCGKLAGPCDRCGRYYIRRRSHKNKRYCSRKCGSQATAAVAALKARRKIHADKLRRAQKAIEEWERLRHKPDIAWKTWVSKTTREVGITPKFLTRAVNKNELQPPRNERKTK